MRKAFKLATIVILALIFASVPFPVFAGVDGTGVVTALLGETEPARPVSYYYKCKKPLCGIINFKEKILSRVS